MAALGQVYSTDPLMLRWQDEGLLRSVGLYTSVQVVKRQILEATGNDFDR